MAHHSDLDDFGWHDSGDRSGTDGFRFNDDRDVAGGQAVTFDKFDVTTFLHADNAADGSFSEQFILNVKGFELNGAPVDIPGFGLTFGMYFLIDATGQQVSGATSFDTMNIALMVDRGADDGTPTSTQDGIGFANGTQGDFALLHGSLVSATLDIAPDGTRHPNYVQEVTPTKEGWKLLGSSVTPGDLLQELLTTPGGPQVIPTGDGNAISLVNGWGFGTVGLTADALLTIRPEQSSHDKGGYGGGACWVSADH